MPQGRFEAGYETQSEARIGQFSGVVFRSRGCGIFQGRQRGLQGIACSRGHRFDLCVRPLWRVDRGSRRFDDQLGHAEPEGSGRVEHLGCGEPEFGAPHGGVDEENEPATIEVRQPRMRGQRGGQAGAQPLVQRVKPQGATQGVERSVAKQRIERGLRRAFLSRA